MKPIISVEGLGKSYTIRHEGQTRYKSLREELFKLPQRLLQRRCQNQEEFWALKDVSFDVMPGDRVGIIGRNGAGKSTLLKLLSRITEPTTGRITLRGRVASLLEVGTGFHPELTGRENIFLNGAILGMSRAEVRRKFDEIVDFAGVKKFLDTPVKRYSSGMYVRLAFAVAAHLEPEILIVDEVLAVGDAEFQKKCLGKMEEISTGQGRTVIFVSHNIVAVKNLCNKGLLLTNGRKHVGGVINKVIQEYTLRKKTSSPSHIQFIDAHGNTTNPTTGKEVYIYFTYTGERKSKITNFELSHVITDRLGHRVILSNLFVGFTVEQIEKNEKFICKIKNTPFIPGDYTIYSFIKINEDFFKSEEIPFTVSDGDFFGGPLFYKQEWDGPLVEQEWGKA